MIEFTVFREYSLIYQVVSAYSFLSKKKGGGFPPYSLWQSHTLEKRDRPLNRSSR